MNTQSLDQLHLHGSEALERATDAVLVVTNDAGSRPLSARHAGVLPSQLLRLVSKPLQSDDPALGSIGLYELVCWRRASDISATQRAQLLRQYINRTARMSAPVRGVPLRIRVGDDWGRLLTHTERREMRELFEQGLDLQLATVGEVAQALRKHVPPVLGLLARIEAVDWQPPPPETLGLREDALADAEARELISASAADDGQAARAKLAEALEAVAALPWAAAVAPGDLRFACPEDEPPLQWAAGQAQAAHPHPAAHALLQRMLAAAVQTVAEEIAEIARLCVPGHQSRVGREERVRREVGVFLRRHLAPIGPGPTFQQIADELGVTKARVRHVCEPILQVLRGSAAVGRLAMPALDRALAAAAMRAPRAVDHLDLELQSLLGPDAGIESLVAFAAALGRPAAVEIHTQQLEGEGDESPMAVRLVVPPRIGSAAPALLKHAGRECSYMGCTNLQRTAGVLALDDGIALDREVMAQLLEATPGFRWLDRGTGWFTLGDALRSGAATRVRKILAAADGPVHVESIGAALVADTRWLARGAGDRPLAVPPASVLRDLLAGWPWLRQVQSSRFQLAEAADADVLTVAESVAIGVIVSHDGIAAAHELREALVARAGLTSQGVSELLAHSPVIERVEYGLYRVRGQRVGDVALHQARQRVRALKTAAALAACGTQDEHAIEGLKSS